MLLKSNPKAGAISITRMDILSQPVLPPDHRIAYGADPSQFGDLWLPHANGSRVPLVVFFHGGWWKSEYDLGYAGLLCAALKEFGIATWSIEYRRLGATGGGWPVTFQDAAAGFDFIHTLAKMHPVDLSRVITMGHSAGGHLAFWIAGRHHIAAGSEIALSPPKTSSRVWLLGAVALAGAVDLRLTITQAGDSTFAHDRQEVYALMGGTPEQHPERYKAGNPGDLLPLNVPQILIQGSEDDQIPPNLPAHWVELADRAGDRAEACIVPSADHFAVVDPASNAWKTVSDSVRRLLLGGQGRLTV